MADDKALVDLLENRIPQARQSLRDSHKNLDQLATYCEQKYTNTDQSKATLEETKNYAAQSLSSVAYQVQVLASGMLELLDKQMKYLGQMESNIHRISQVWDEKKNLAFRGNRVLTVMSHTNRVSLPRCVPIPVYNIGARTSKSKQCVVLIVHPFRPLKTCPSFPL